MDASHSRGAGRTSACNHKMWQPDNCAGATTSRHVTGNRHTSRFSSVNRSWRRCKRRSQGAAMSEADREPFTLNVAGSGGVAHDINDEIGQFHGVGNAICLSGRSYQGAQHKPNDRRNFASVLPTFRYRFARSHRVMTVQKYSWINLRASPQKAKFLMKTQARLLKKLPQARPHQPCPHHRLPILAPPSRLTGRRLCCLACCRT